jgi:hypothetical protein
MDTVGTQRMSRLQVVPADASAGQPCERCGDVHGHADARDWHMPVTLPAELMGRIGAAVWQRLPSDVGVHFVVIASGGFGVGVAAAIAAPPSRLRSVTVVKPMYDFVSPALAPEPGEVAVVLDNSIHTGRSASRTLEHLRARSVPVAAVVTVFDAAHACEAEARRSLEAETGIPVLACAPWQERHDWA